MTSLETLLANPYANVHVSNFRLAGAVFVLIPKLTAANGGGEYTAVIAQLNTAYPPYADKIVEIATGVSLGKGFTVTREGVAADFVAFVSDNQIDVQVIYKLNPTKILEFYPQGMKTYNAGNKGSWMSLMDFYGAAATANHADFPAQFVIDANAFSGRYHAASDTQSGEQTIVGNDRGDRDTNRIALEDVCFTMLHTVFIVTQGNLTKIKAIIDLKSLESHPRTTVLHINNAAIAPDTTVNLMHQNFDITYVIFVRNIGITDLRICLSHDATTACTTDGQTLRAGHAHTYIMPTLGNLANTFLNITNLDLTNNGAYEVSVRRE
ncbi:MAG: hypothetical protein WCR66_14395 [Bacteroidota bacterium]